MTSFKTAAATESLHEKQELLYSFFAKIRCRAVVTWVSVPFALCILFVTTFIIEIVDVIAEKSRSK